MREFEGFFRQLLSMRNAGGIEHAELVTSLSMELGGRLGLDAVQLESLYFGALGQDIGKLSVNDVIMNKPGKLNRSEVLLMRQHPVEGALLLMKLDGHIHEDVPAMVLDHHEDFDGLGYPNHKRGEDIHWGARIIRLTDSYAAMTAMERPFRRLKTHAEAVVDLQETASRYDPGMLPVFLEVLHGRAHERGQ